MNNCCGYGWNLSHRQSWKGWSSWMSCNKKLRFMPKISFVVSQKDLWLFSEVQPLYSDFLKLRQAVMEWMLEAHTPPYQNRWDFRLTKNFLWSFSLCRQIRHSIKSSDPFVIIHSPRHPEENNKTFIKLPDHNKAFKGEVQFFAH